MQSVVQAVTCGGGPVLSHLLDASVASTSSETTAQPEADRNHGAWLQDLMLPAQLHLLTRHHQHSGKTALTKQDTWLECPSTTLKVMLSSNLLSSVLGWSKE